MIAFRDKDRALDAIANVAEAEAQYAAACLSGKPMNEALAKIIGQAVAAGIAEAIKQAYSQDDFEKDLNLQPDPNKT